MEVNPTPTPTPTPVVSTLDSVKAFLIGADATFATALANNGAERFRLFDSCFLNGGESKAYRVKNYDDNLLLSQQQNAFLVGSTRTNVQVVAERKITNADGTTRLEADVIFDTVYKDGTITTAAGSVPTTVVLGSSAGTCATPTNSAELRFLGDQRKVFVDLQARNIRTDNFSIVTGAPGVTTPTSQRREIRFRMIDAANVATYAIVTGPGPTGANGQPFSFKLLSPRILRSAPELAGKTGNATSLADTDTFKACRIVGAAVPTADVADCVGQGANFDHWGFNLSANAGDPAAQKVSDDGFAAQGWVAGGNYTFAVYADDGWKTVNGQAGKVPIATYTAALRSLPYTFAQMNSAASGASYPSFTTNLTTAQIAALFTVSGGPVTLNGLQAAAPSGEPRTTLSFLNVFAAGPNIGATGGFPRTEQNDLFYPGVNATSGTVVIKGKNPATSATTFGQIGSGHSDRNGRLMQRRWDFQ